MTAAELRLEVFEALEERFRQRREAEGGSPFVGMQGDKVVVMQAGGEHLAVLVVPARVEVGG